MLNPQKQLKLQKNPLSEREVDLILLIREKLRYGEVTIETRAGEPYRIARVTTYDKLGD